MDTIIDDNARVGEPGLELGRDVGRSTTLYATVANVPSRS